MELKKGEYSIDGEMYQTITISKAALERIGIQHYKQSQTSRVAKTYHTGIAAFVKELLDLFEEEGNEERD